MAIKSKPELFQLILDNLPSTNAKFITAERIREVLDDFVASNLTFNILTITSSPVSVNEDVDLIIVKAGADVINFPAIADFKDRVLGLLNISGSTVTVNAAGGDTVDSAASLIVIDRTSITFTPDQSASDWNAILTLRAKIHLVAADEANALLTTINTQGDFEDINCTLGATGPIGLFSISGNQITYNGDADIDVEVDWGFGGTSAFNDKEIAGKVIKNFGLGSEVILGGRSTANFHTTKVNSGPLFTRTTLITGDILHFTITNLTDSNNVTITDQTLQIDEL